MDIQPGSIWEHYKGGLYEVVSVIENKTTDEPMVLYQGGGKLYVRTEQDWVAKFKPRPSHG